MADLATAQARGDLQSFGRRIKKLEKTVAFLRSSLDTVGRATVDSTRGLAVNGLLKVAGTLELIGNLSLQDVDGTELVRLGDLLFGKGIQFTRTDGSVAASFGKPFSVSTEQAFLLYDTFGSQILGESTLGGGVGRPLMENPVQPVADTTGTAAPTIGPYGWERTVDPAVALNTWKTLFAYDGRTQNGFLKFKFAFICSDGTTAGETRLINLDTGNPISGFLVPPLISPIPAGSTTYQVLDPAAASFVTPALFGNAYTAFRIGVQARRTAGTGTITLAVPQAMGG